MQNLRQIVLMVQEQYPELLESFTQSVANEKSKKLCALLQGVLSGEFQDDDTAAKALYNSTKKNAAYNFLKHTLRKNLISSLIPLDAASKNKCLSTYQQAKYDIKIDLLSIDILTRNGASGWKEIAVEALKKARKYGFSDLAAECCEYLGHLYCLQGDTKEFKRIQKDVLEYRKTALIESECLGYLREMRSVVVKKTVKKDDSIITSHSYLNRIADYLSQHKTPNLHFVWYRYNILHHQLVRDFETVIRYCNEFEKYFEKNPHMIQNRRLAEISIYKMACYSTLGKYLDGHVHAEKALKTIPKGTNNWFALNEHYLILLLRGGETNEAQRVYDTVVRLERFKRLPSAWGERWTLLGAYLCYYRGETMPLYKFLNDVPTYSMDKHGLNVAIWVLQMLILFRKRELDAILDKRDALESYCKRYLNDKDSQRAKALFKCFIVVMNKNFDVHSVTKAAQRWIKQLPPNGSQRYQDFEIMPFQTVWNTVLQHLKEYEESCAVVVPT